MVILINRNDDIVQINGYTFEIGAFCDEIISANCSISGCDGTWSFTTLPDSDPVELDEAVAVVKALQGLTDGTIKFSE